MNKINLNTHFYLSEFECHDGSHLVKIDERLLDLLLTLRNVLKKPIRITSGYRTTQYNAFISESPKSQHLDGRAADIQVEGYMPEEVFVLAKKMGFDGIGLYNTFVHVDVRGIKVDWIDKSYVKKKNIKNI